MAPRERRSPIAAPKPLHILIVDDHTLITDMLELFLGDRKSTRLNSSH